MEKKEVKSPFDVLNAVDCKEHLEKKNGLTYLSWAWAWAELKKRYPLSFYTIYENRDGWNYFTDGRSCWVKTGVTLVWIEDGVRKELEHIEDLPVMDFKNKSIKLDFVTSYDVNKSIQRSLTKAVARHGLGLYVYAGEDIPEEGDGDSREFKPIPQPNKDKPKSKGLVVWEKYRTVASSSNPELDDATIKQSFAKMVRELTGKVHSNELTDDEWSKVEAQFTA